MSHGARDELARRIERLEYHQQKIRQSLDSIQRAAGGDRPSNPDKDPDIMSRRAALTLGAMIGGTLTLGTGVDPSAADTVITNNPTPTVCTWRGPQDASTYSLLNLGLLDLDDQRGGGDQPAGIVNVDGKLYRVEER